MISSFKKQPKYCVVCGLKLFPDAYIIINGDAVCSAGECLSYYNQISGK